MSGDARSTEFWPEDLVKLLGRHRVPYILVGDLAAILHGSPILTVDIEICHATDTPNLEALARALADVDVASSELDARTLATGNPSRFTTDVGAFSIVATPAGTQGYDDLVRGAGHFEAFGLRFQVAGIDDLIHMKRAAGRPRDRVELEILGALREEIDRNG